VRWQEKRDAALDSGSQQEDSSRSAARQSAPSPPLRVAGALQRRDGIPLRKFPISKELGGSARQVTSACSILVALQTEKMELVNDQQIVNTGQKSAPHEAVKKAEPQIGVNLHDKTLQAGGGRAEYAKKTEENHHCHTQSETKGQRQESLGAQGDLSPTKFVFGAPAP
jgi:hypothetical protein